MDIGSSGTRYFQILVSYLVHKKFYSLFKGIQSMVWFQNRAIRHSVDRALPALSALSDLQLSQLFQLSQFCQFFHSSDALSSPSSSNFEIENWKSLWKNERTNGVGRAGKARRAGKIGDPRELRELEEPKASEERETYKVQEWTAFQAWTLTLVASRSQQSALA